MAPRRGAANPGGVAPNIFSTLRGVGISTLELTGRWKWCRLWLQTACNRSGAGLGFRAELWPHGDFTAIHPVKAGADFLASPPAGGTGPRPTWLAMA